MLKQQNDDIIIKVKIHPNAKQNSIDGTWNDCFKISIKTPPENGKANTELINFLSKLLNKKKSEIQILSGQTSHQKTILVKDMNKDNLTNILHS